MFTLHCGAVLPIFSGFLGTMVVEVYPPLKTSLNSELCWFAPRDVPIFEDTHVGTELGPLFTGGSVPPTPKHGAGVGGPPIANGTPLTQSTAQRTWKFSGYGLAGGLVLFSQRFCNVDEISAHTCFGSGSVQLRNSNPIWNAVEITKHRSWVVDADFL